MKRNIIYGCTWEKGQVKVVNEDSLFLRTIKTRNGNLVAACICDGMGGIGNGEIASGYVLEQLEQWLFEECLSALRRSRKGRVIKGKGIRFFQRINRELFEYMKRKRIPLGTTASILILYEKWGYIFHIGDSRIYCLYSCPVMKRASLVKVLTKDHKKEESTLTRCLGLNPEGKPDVSRFRIPKKNCGFLLCSDGFYRKMEKHQLKQLAPGLLKSEKDIEKRLEEMGKRMEKKGEKDNWSALYVKVE